MKTEWKPLWSPASFGVNGKGVGFREDTPFMVMGTTFSWSSAVVSRKGPESYEGEGCPEASPPPRSTGQAEPRRVRGALHKYHCASAFQKKS